ncbi:MAG: ABC transporter ATP-binding protein [Dehalococcoidia bacterium]|nr:ABC transporter ATP-binding protein [Dehalococcoidia bacterium]
MIEMKGIVKSYTMGTQELRVLNGIDLTIADGEMVAIMGPSGSGKSTLLNIMGCLDSPTSGSYLLDGREVSRLSPRELATIRGKKVGFVFQSYNLLPRLTALANVRLGLSYAGIHDQRLAEQALEMVGLSARAKHKPTELSGGEQQRVAIARPPPKGPSLVLADEPTGNLDSKSSKEIISILTGLHRERRITLVIITHDPGVAGHCQRIVRISDGKIIGEEKI